MLKKILPHLAALVGFVIIAFIYCTPVLQGKRLNQTDTMMAKAAAKESSDFHEKNGYYPWWTNSMFGGMPTYMIAGDYPNSVSSKVGSALNYILPSPVNFLFFLMAGMYVLLIVLGCSVWQSVLGSVAFCFGTYNLLNIEAGHISKVLALAYAPPMMAGLILIMRGRWMLGTALSALFFSLQLYANHVQITYYMAIAFGIWVLVEAVKMIRAGQTKNLVISLALMAVAAVVAVGSHATRLWNNYEYAKETIRGGSELSTKTEVSGSKTGLDRDYAFGWSYGIAEMGTLLIPNFYGGASNGGLDTKSATYKTLEGRIDSQQAEEIVERAMPLYWGEMPFTGGPAYAGAIVCFLFVLGMFIARGSLRWWILGMTIMFALLSMGKNLSSLNYFLFDYLPLYNKFRAVNMILSVMQIFLAMGAVLALKTLSDENWTFDSLKKPLAWSVGLTAGLALIFAILPTAFFSFRSANDATTLSQIGGKEFVDLVSGTLVQDRISVFQADAWRSIIFILLSAGALVLFVRKTIKSTIFYPILLLLIIVDLFLVDKRYFANDSFFRQSDIEESFEPTPADNSIMADKTLPRVMDNTANFMSSAVASYFHQSIGGYHAAKLRRYNELIEKQVYNNNMSVLNMLNVKYIMGKGQDGQTLAQTNASACGRVWFVKNYKIVATAEEELKSLDKFDPKATAFIDKKFEEQLKGLNIVADSVSNTITLKSYAPNEIVYESNCKTEQLAVFSEIYYRGGIDWISSVDGQEAPHMRANYVLRAMRVPAGKHSITFKFDPVSVRQGGRIDLAASIILLLLIGGAVFIEFRKKPTAQ